MPFDGSNGQNVTTPVIQNFRSPIYENNQRTLISIAQRNAIDLDIVS